MKMRQALQLLLLASAWPLLAQAVKIPLSKGSVSIKTPWHLWHQQKQVQGYALQGMRVPHKYFVLKGFGETDQGSGTNPFETGAHDLAMEDAGIHNFNLMTYTSILPREAEEISFEEAQKYFHHGAVLECILAEQHGGRGDRVTAGVGRMMVVDQSTGGKRMGGFAVEYEGHASEEVATQQLDEALDGLFDRRFSASDHSKEQKLFTVASQDVHKAFGTAIAGICFCDYLVPVFSSEMVPAEPPGKQEL